MKFTPQRHDFKIIKSLKQKKKKNMSKKNDITFTGADKGNRMQ